MSFEQQYYETHRLLSPESVPPSDFQRIDEALGALSDDAESLLDVGCQNGICCDRALEQHPRLRRVVGIDRNPEALKYVKAEKYVSDISAMPFADREFDTSVVLEVLEHLPLPCFRKAIPEIARVTRQQIIVTVPNNEDLPRSFAECPSCRTRFHRSLHMRSFDRAKLRKLFVDTGFVCRQVRPTGPCRYVGLGLILTAVHKLRGTHAAMNHAMCPVCAYSDQQRTQNFRRPRNGSFLKQIARRFWPKVPPHRWLMAVYERG